MRKDVVSKGLELSSVTPVQTTLLPMLLPSDRLKRSLYLPYDPPSDICVSAPTGSGKTLAYVLPIVEVGTLRTMKNRRDNGEQVLSSRAVTRLRALVVLPTRDLVVQVRETFEAIAKGRGLKVSIAALSLLALQLDMPLSLDRLCNWPAFILSRASPAREQRADVRAGSPLQRPTD